MGVGGVKKNPQTRCRQKKEKRTKDGAAYLGEDFGKMKSSVSPEARWYLG